MFLAAKWIYSDYLSERKKAGKPQLVLLPFFDKNLYS
jgi:hypothetical protein